MEVTVMPNPASVEKQQGLNQLVINKVQRMVEGKRQGVMETIARLLDEGNSAGLHRPHRGEPARQGETACHFIPRGGPGANDHAGGKFQSARQCHQPDFGEDGGAGQVPARTVRW